MKHIRMPKAIAEAWLKDLRSNPKQGFGFLEDALHDGHCCLGRLQVVVSGDVEREEDGWSWKSPSFKWLKENGIEFLNKKGATSNHPYCAEKDLYFAQINDTKVPFPIIADLLEAEIEYND